MVTRAPSKNTLDMLHKGTPHCAGLTRQQSLLRSTQCLIILSITATWVYQPFDHKIEHRLGEKGNLVIKLNGIGKIFPSLSPIFRRPMSSLANITLTMATHFLRVAPPHSKGFAIVPSNRNIIILSIKRG